MNGNNNNQLVKITPYEFFAIKEEVSIFIEICSFCMEYELGCALAALRFTYLPVIAVHFQHRSGVYIFSKNHFAYSLPIYNSFSLQKYIFFSELGKLNDFKGKYTMNFFVKSFKQIEKSCLLMSTQKFFNKSSKIIWGFILKNIHPFHRFSNRYSFKTCN